MSYWGDLKDDDEGMAPPAAAPAPVAPPNDSRLPVRTCAICGSAEGVRRFAVTVDGDELRAVADLCAEHGDAHLLNVGRVLGELFAARKGSSRS